MQNIIYQNTIKLNPVTKKNHQQIWTNKKTGRPFVQQSKQYLQYKKDIAWFLKSVETISEPMNIKALFYMKTRRTVDLSNLMEAIADLLVKYKIIEDDNCKFVKGWDGSRVLYDKENPRTELYISRWEEGL